MGAAMLDCIWADTAGSTQPQPWEQGEAQPRGAPSPAVLRSLGHLPRIQQSPASSASHGPATGRWLVGFGGAGEVPSPWWFGVQPSGRLWHRCCLLWQALAVLVLAAMVELCLRHCTLQGSAEPFLGKASGWFLSLGWDGRGSAGWRLCSLLALPPHRPSSPSS